MENKLKLLQGQYDILKDKFTSSKDLYNKEITKLKSDLEVEKEKNLILCNQLIEKDEKIKTLSLDIQKLTETKVTLISEVTCLNNYIQKQASDYDVLSFEVQFYKSEMTSCRNLLNNKDQQLKKADENYNNLNLIMKEYQSTLIDMEVTNYFFQVLRIGAMIDTKADVSKIINHLIDSAY